jgi:hypothetical protein
LFQSFENNFGDIFSPRLKMFSLDERVFKLLEFSPPRQSKFSTTFFFSCAGPKLTNKNFQRTPFVPQNSPR